LYDINIYIIFVIQDICNELKFYFMSATAQKAAKMMNRLDERNLDVAFAVIRQPVKTQEKEREARKQAFCNSPEALEALEEAKQLRNNPNAKSFSTMEELIADLESDDDE